MKAVMIKEFGGRDKLVVTELPTPRPGRGEVLIKVKAAGVNPVDCAIREGWLAKFLPHQFPLIPGWDAAGIVWEIGAEATSFIPGDEVYAYCRKPVVQFGAYAEYIVLPETMVALKPSKLSFEEAASVPLAALTAYQSLFEAVNLQKNETILIHAAAGGVGGFAVQLASLHGAQVIGTARSINHSYVRKLGAQKVIDYAMDDLNTAIYKEFPGGLDAALDSIGGAVTIATMELLKQGGRMASLLTPKDKGIEEKAAARKIRYEYVFVRPDAAQLVKLAGMLDAGTLRTHLSAVLPLDDVAKAHELIEARHTQGKIVLAI